MLSCWRVPPAAPRGVRIGIVLGFLVGVSAAGESVAQPAASDTSVTYAEMWTPRSQTGAIHLHGGVFARTGANSTTATLGTRLGVNLGTHLLLGVMGDWTFKSKKVLQPVDVGPPGFQPSTVLAQANAHLVPAMAFLQVRLTDKFPLVPYAGVGAGYEWLILTANDYRTEASATTTFSNWAWQGYAGLGIRLSRGQRLDGELFFNGASLARETTDQNGDPWREIVDVTGVGARIGVNIVY